LKIKEKHHEHFISFPVTPYGRPNNNTRTNFVVQGPGLVSHGLANNSVKS